MSKPGKNTTSLINSLVYPIVISTPFAVGNVYSYLVRDEKKVLVDCGHQSESSYQQVTKGLEEQGLSIEDLDEIWLTHGHPDHSGQAAILAVQSDAVVKGHPKERANFAGNTDRSSFRSFFEMHHISSPVIEVMLTQLDWLQQFQRPVKPEWVSEGDQLCSGKLTFTVKHTPGHAPGHVVFYQEDGLFFGGDVLLEHISTNAIINFDPDSGARNKSLLQYRDSLKWIKNCRGHVLPGHGKRITDIGKIANHHLVKQNERYTKIKDLLYNQPQKLIELSKAVFPDALKKDAYFLVFSEIVGYLDWGIESDEIIMDENCVFCLAE